MAGEGTVEGGSPWRMRPDNLAGVKPATEDKGPQKPIEGDRDTLRLGDMMVAKENAKTIEVYLQNTNK